MAIYKVKITLQWKYIEWKSSLLKIYRVKLRSELEADRRLGLPTPNRSRTSSSRCISGRRGPKSYLLDLFRSNSRGRHWSCGTGIRLWQDRQHCSDCTSLFQSGALRKVYWCVPDVVKNVSQSLESIQCPKTYPDRFANLAWFLYAAFICLSWCRS